MGCEKGPCTDLKPLVGLSGITLSSTVRSETSLSMSSVVQHVESSDGGW